MNPEDKLAERLLSILKNDFSDVTKYDETTPQKIMKKYVNEILSFLEETVTIKVTYVGVLNAGGADPVTTDTIKIKTTDLITPYVVVPDSPLGATYNNWCSYIISSIFSNTWIGKGSYLDEPVMPIVSLDSSILSKIINQSVVRSVYDDNCDNDGRLKSDVDIASECQKSLCKELLNIIKTSPSLIPYATSNIAKTSSGTVTLVQIDIKLLE